jgi:hypothetical protein
MRPSLIAFLVPLLAAAGANAAVKSPHAAPDPWELERAKTNEHGFYPVPEFLRETGLRPPPGSPRIEGERSEGGVAYRTARRALIKQGFIPVKILSQDNGRETCSGTGATCRIFPELLQCTAGGMQHCAFLYRQQTTGNYWIVSTIGEEGVAPDVDFRLLRCCGYRPATEYYLDGVAILRPNGRPFRFQYAHPPPPDPPLPLCSEVGGKMPCWIKPPPGVRRRK